MAKNTVILKGNIIYAPTGRALTALENGYIMSEDGVVVDVFPKLPERYAGVEITDFNNAVIMPGMVDLHLHAPQYAVRGMGMDLEMIPWLNKYAFTEEAKYEDDKYTEVAYKAFYDALKQSATTRACIYATLHVRATKRLMEMLEESGLVTYVGKVNMDRNCPKHLVETAERSIADTEEWIQYSKTFKNTKPIITPRFVPSCSGELMAALGGLAKRYDLPVQSHLSENRNEVKWVKQLHPEFTDYGDVYYHFGLFGQQPTIMAHCVLLADKEMNLMRDSGVYAAHCPQSNINLSSGIAPVRRLLDKGIRVGLGTDVAGGFSISVFRAVSDAIQMSKLYSVLLDEKCVALTFPEAFYLATKGGGSFFGKVGSFEPGYEMDAVVVDDTEINGLSHLTLPQRLERIVHLTEDRNIRAKYVMGVRMR